MQAKSSVQLIDGLRQGRCVGRRQDIKYQGSGLARGTKDELEAGKESGRSF